MAKVVYHVVLDSFQGKLCGLIFKKIRGRGHVTQSPRPPEKRTPNQVAWQAKFRRCADFAHSAKNVPELVALYGPIAKAQNRRINNIAMSDAFDPPKIGLVDLSAFTGAVGSPIRITASDPFGVVEVTVRI